MVRFIIRFAVVALSVAAVSVTINSAVAAPQAAPQRSEGEQLFQQGHYPEAMAWWTEHAAQGDIESARAVLGSPEFAVTDADRAARLDSDLDPNDWRVVDEPGPYSMVNR